MNLAPLWKIEDELCALLDTLDVCPQEQRPELEERIAEYVGYETAKIDAIAAVFSSLDSICLSAKAEIDRLVARQQSAEKSAERLEQYVLRILRQRDGQVLKGHLASFSLRRSESLVILDPELVPDCWKRTTIVTDILKPPIKAALKAGQEIPGVMIQIKEHLVKR